MPRPDRGTDFEELTSANRDFNEPAPPRVEGSRQDFRATAWDESGAAWANIDKTGIDIAATNIRTVANMALAFYADEKPKTAMPPDVPRLGFLPTAATLLTLFDESSNDSILIGTTLNSVYQFGNATQWVFTYYSIGGTGGPYISVQNFNTNGEDPLGEFWKCSESGYRRQRIMSYDGVSFCVPQQVIAYDYAFSRNFYESFTDDTTAQNRVGLLNTFYKMLSEIEISRTGKDKNQVVQEYEQRAIDLYGGVDDPAVDFNYGLISHRELILGAMHFPAHADHRTEVIKVPWESATLKLLDIGYAGRPQGITITGGGDRLTSRAQIQITSFYENLGAGTDPASVDADTAAEIVADYVIKPFDQYAESFLIEQYASSNIARESEYQVQYGELEARRLKYLYGYDAFSLGDMLNNIYMGTARYLASTFLQSVYTFKTITMPPLTPHSFAPPTLADAISSAEVDAYNIASTPFSPESYYASEYAEVEGMTSPAAPSAFGFAVGEGIMLSSLGESELTTAMASTGPIDVEYDSTFTLDRPVGALPSTGGGSTGGGGY